ncbi:MAG: isoprenylcysteine carboxylmethyltransferase family protein [Nanoarchaeota archaeon]|nr:isoprenylcysteine carboxylmethyltransferase family protein [Nanoarchaeota archaeon]MBU4242544.1 isoprenylcysteine carboxylmethyltransferase family protein [Nanoarchaeota archaeon]MBU4352637.1 isoprenylcysteine carboxylmethyltransferase family protein [Nanoarchaeota archaeon]MBU4456090.1 isoprenylcysteine carboxylmethyltransferase family protein [Nanoarchaeota archaeon]MCG2719920.1 isoprenylcysteine carboxylmethyltransferase family protein [Nanoarchaeota archaeon]
MGFKDLFYLFTGFTKSHKEDQGSLIFLVFGVLLISAVSFVEWYFMHKGFTLVSYLGIIVALIGFFIRWFGAIILKHQYLQFSVIERRKLVTQGLYSKIRHPCYLGVFIALFGIAMFFSSWAGLLIHLFVIFPLGLRRISNVEAKLSEHFGNSYKKYMKDTKKLIPGIY